MREIDEYTDGFGPIRTLVTGADDGSRWRGPGENHGFDAVVQNGSAFTLPTGPHATRPRPLAKVVLP